MSVGFDLPFKRRRASQERAPDVRLGRGACLSEARCAEHAFSEKRTVWLETSGGKAPAEKAAQLDAITLYMAFIC